MHIGLYLYVYMYIHIRPCIVEGEINEHKSMGEFIYTDIHM
jgi:hypothetical protein